MMNSKVAKDATFVGSNQVQDSRMLPDPRSLSSQMQGSTYYVLCSAPRTTYFPTGAPYDIRTYEQKKDILGTLNYLQLLYISDHENFN